MLRRLLLAQRGGLPNRTSTPGLRRRNMSIFGYTVTATKRSSQPKAPLRERYPNGHVFARSFGYGLMAYISMHIFFDHFFTWRATWGPSMLPTLNASGTTVIISKYYRRGRGIEVGDMVSFKHPVQSEINAIKRVIGMPGDFVLRDTPDQGDGTMIQVPTGHCWLVGDNLPASRDSRIYGPVPLALIKGKVIALWNNWLEFPKSVQPAFQDVQDVQDKG
ncbi:unnamed protein product [Aureobasidium pullulans]|nr:unnamed protein product [Aureobasidium pullulans]